MLEKLGYDTIIQCGGSAFGKTVTEGTRGQHVFYYGYDVLEGPQWIIYNF